MNSIKLLLALSLAATSSLTASPSLAASPVIDLPEVVITGGSYELEFAALHYAMAEAVGANADAAYEDAIELTDELSLAHAKAAVQMCPESSWIRVIAGGYMGVCGAADGSFLGFATLNGVKLGSSL